eukprot:scaffold56200_cov19-Tisochrysis_lutea.AAC.3
MPLSGPGQTCALTRSHEERTSATSVALFCADGHVQSIECSMIQAFHVCKHWRVWEAFAAAVTVPAEHVTLPASSNATVCC